MISELQLANFLVRLGHLDLSKIFSDVALEEAVRSFQRFHGLKDDGEVGQVTMETLEKRQQCGCGLPDIMQAGTSVCKWPMSDVRYFIASTPNGLSVDEAKGCYRRAWASWQAVCGINPIEVTDPTTANVIMTTGRGSRAQFDGPMGVLAWSQLPCGATPKTRLEQEFDLDEKYGTTTAGGAILLENVACHEIGHVIGLSHIPASQAKALMNPIYSPSVGKPLAADISEVVSRYGTAAPIPTSPVPPTPSPIGGVITITIPAGQSVVINGRTYAA